MNCELTSEGFLLRENGLPFSHWGADETTYIRAAYATLASLAEESSGELLLDEGS